MTRGDRVEPRLPGRLFQRAGRYSDFLGKREEFLSAQLGQQQALTAKVRQEVEWLQARGAGAHHQSQRAHRGRGALNG